MAEFNAEAAKKYAERVQYINDNFGDRKEPVRETVYNDDTPGQARFRENVDRNDRNPNVPKAAIACLNDKEYMNIENDLVSSEKDAAKALDSLKTKYSSLPSNISTFFPENWKELDKSEIENLTKLKDRCDAARNLRQDKIEQMAKDHDVTTLSLTRALNSSRGEISGIDIEKANKERSEKVEEKEKNDFNILPPTVSVAAEKSSSQGLG